MLHMTHLAKKVFYPNGAFVACKAGLNQVKIFGTRRESIHGGSIPSIPAREGPENSPLIQPFMAPIGLREVPFVFYSFLGRVLSAFRLRW